MSPEPNRTPLRVGTRGSDLALTQAKRVAGLIEARTGRASEIVIIETQGDRDTTSPLDGMGGVGVFTKEIERALLDRRCDVAVHSLKDLPTRLADGLALAAVPERAAVHDVLVSRAPLEALPKGARVGTSSRRRRAQLLALRPDLFCEEIRGNVPTRVERCRRGLYDAIVLASAGLDRLGLDVGPDLRRFDLPLERFLPAPGQGALGVETRAEDAALLAPLDDAALRRAVGAERELLRLIEGGCSVPLGAHATLLEDGRVLLAASLADPGSSRLRRALTRASTPEAAAALAYRILKPDAGEEPVALPSLAGKRIVLTREDPDLERALAAAGAVVRVAPSIEVVQVAPAPSLPRCAWTLVSSAKAAGALEREKASLEKVGAIGAGTAAALAERGIAVDLLAAESTAEGFAAAFLERKEPRGTTVLLPAARDGRPELRERLATAGYAVRTVPVYESRPLTPDLSNADLVVFASPSGVRETAEGVSIVAIGPTTEVATRRMGQQASVAGKPTTRGILEAIARTLSGGA